jgi:hypothetical protein
MAEMTPPATLQELKIALCRVQSLEPAGVGARNVAECLTLQLRLMPRSEAQMIAIIVCKQHLDLLARRDLKKLMAATGADEELLGELEDYGLVRHARTYGTEALTVVRSAVAVREYGIQPRHLRADKWHTRDEFGPSARANLGRDKEREEGRGGVNAELIQKFYAQQFHRLALLLPTINHILTPTFDRGTRDFAKRFYVNRFASFANAERHNDKTDD